MFTVEEIKARVRKRPFRPLRFATTSGESFEVRHPELIMIGSHGVEIGIASRADPSVYDQVVHVPRLHISLIEELPPEGDAKGLGVE